MAANEEDVKNYLVDLESDDIEVRNLARRQLTNIGPEIIPDLIYQLKNDKQQCRWEAAKILGEIRDPAAADALVDALLDDSISVHWAVSEALIKYGRDAILPLLEGITRHFDSMRFRQGAYHILHVLERFHQLDPKTQEVLDSLRSIQPSVTAPWAAERAIEALRFGK
jgi:hypothetical protein